MTADTAPLDIDDDLAVRDCTLLGDEAERVFAPFAQHADQVDVVRIHRGTGRPIIMLSERVWRRLLLAAKKASEAPDNG